MHPVNRLLSWFGLTVTRSRREFARGVPAEFRNRYFRDLSELRRAHPEVEVLPDFRFDAGEHPQSYKDFECEFVARHLANRPPGAILDIGSYRWFILGLLAHYPITTLDVRRRASTLHRETVLTCDAKHLDLPDNSFDTIISLCTLEHLGLGRYGDAVDFDSDRAAFQEMIRVLRPGGVLLFSTTVTNARPSIAFNAQRIYSYSQIQSFCQLLKLREEAFFSRRCNHACSLSEVVTINAPKQWDVYCGCWMK